MVSEYKIATTLDDAWLNFELDLPLPPGPNGEPNPFYVDRPGNPTDRLVRELLREYHLTPKYFLSGHRGCGKSTELRKLAANPKILEKYWPVHYSIRDEGDINNLDYRDVLLSIGGQMYRQYHQTGKRLPKQLLAELDSFRGRVEETVTIASSRLAETEIEGKLDAFFAQAGLKIKLEPRTRTLVRQVIEQSISELISLLGLIATAIYTTEKRWPLVLIDDLDKPNLERSREIFYEHRESMLQPNVPLVYTVTSPLFYSTEFQAIRDRAIFLPNVKLHEQGQPETTCEQGYRTMWTFALKRMQPDLISDEALLAATRVSGGLFREMARVMRSSIDRATAEAHNRVEIVDVDKAEAEIRGEYTRFITKEQRIILRAVRQNNRYDEPDKVAPLLQMLAVLEYANGEPWCDVHPALLKLLDNTETYDNTPAQS
jgi:hypothetical protein